jgi:hypothetical protein
LLIVTNDYFGGSRLVNPEEFAKHGVVANVGVDVVSKEQSREAEPT